MSRDAGFCVPENPEFITGCSECLSFPHCQYTVSLDLDTFPEIFGSAIIGNYDCEKGLLGFDGLENAAMETICKKLHNNPVKYANL